MYKFGIAIPTYNRKDKLKRCLDSFIEEAKNKNIPIYISDNASNDGTEELIKKYQLKYKNIIYKKNYKNFGLDKNMFQVLEMSKSEYTLWLGDDDTIEKGAIDEIFSNLSSDIDLVILNSRSVNYEKNEIIKNRLNQKENKIYNDDENFFLNFYDKLTFGTIIVKKYLNEIEMDKYIGNFHGYSDYIWEYLSKKEKNHIKIIAKECISWDAGDKEYGEKIIKILLANVPNNKIPLKYEKYFEKWLKNYLKAQTSIKTLISYRKNMKENIKFKKSDYPKLSLLQYLKLKFIFKIPKSIIKIIYYIYKKYKGNKMKNERI